MDVGAGVAAGVTVSNSTTLDDGTGVEVGVTVSGFSTTVKAWPVCRNNAASIHPWTSK